MKEPFTLDSVYIPPGGPPRGPGPSREIYDRMGKENIYKMCEDFYAELEQSDIRPLFSKDMRAASRKIAAFLVGLLGGPPLYHQQYGSPEMRRRHLAFPIDEHARRTWLNCFERVLEDAETRYRFPPEHLWGFKHFLYEFSAWMVNRRTE